MWERKERRHCTGATDTVWQQQGCGKGWRESGVKRNTAALATVLVHAGGQQDEAASHTPQDGAPVNRVLFRECVLKQRNRGNRPPCEGLGLCAPHHQKLAVVKQCLRSCRRYALLWNYTVARQSILL